MMRGFLRTLAIILHFFGPMLMAFGACLLVPLVVAVIDGEIREGYRTFWAFFVPALLSLSVGFSLKRFTHAANPNVIQATLICSIGWLGFSAIGAIPFVIGIHSTYLDGYFEAMSGFTTTGITMYTGLDQMPRSILFWRALTQWVGGLGILTMFLAVSTRVEGSHQLFGAEGHKIEVDRPVPGLANTIRILLGIYILITVMVILSLYALGMSFFDSVCHSFAALATGGYSPYDASIEAYRISGHPNAIWLEYVLIVAMIAGGTNFLVHYRVISRHPRALVDNAEMQAWWKLIGVFTALIMAERFFRIEPLPWGNPFELQFWGRVEEDFRIVLFQVVSVLTTTGFGTRDIASPYFGEAARQLFLVMMVIGGCVGSTGGGIKVLRVVILNRLIRREVFRLRVPSNAITTVVIDGKTIDLDEIQRVAALFFAWVVLLVFGGMVTEFLSKHSGYAAYSGMFSALGNVGPCFISVEDIGKLHPIIKITYIMGMLAGRLEILPVFLLFSRKAWQP
jgi:trk system potassium uptake protein TrkH